MDADPLTYLLRNNRSLQGAAHCCRTLLSIDAANIALTDSTTMG